VNILLSTQNNNDLNIQIHETLSRLLLNRMVKLHFSEVENRLFEMFGNKKTKTINVKKFMAVSTYS